MLSHHLIDCQRQHQLVSILTTVNLLPHPGEFLEHTLLQGFRLQIVQSETNLLIVLIAVKVMTLQVGLLLVGDYLAHQFHSRIVLATIARTLLRLYRNFFQCMVVSSQSNRHLSGCLWSHVDDLLTIAHRTDCQSPSVVAVNAETPLTIGNCRNTVTFVLNSGIRYGVAIGSINHNATDLCKQHQRHCQQE